MSLVKNCLSCGQIYEDLSYHFCLEDGAPLSGEFEIGDEAETVVRRRAIDATDCDEGETETLVRPTAKPFSPVLQQVGFGGRIATVVAGFQRAVRTSEFHPVLNSEPLNSRRLSAWTSSDNIRQITYEITGWQTHHARHNLELLMDYLNEFVLVGMPYSFTETQLHLGTANFYTKDRRLKCSFSFKSEDKPTTAAFLKALFETFAPE